MVHRIAILFGVFLLQIHAEELGFDSPSNSEVELDDAVAGAFEYIDRHQRLLERGIERAISEKANREQIWRLIPLPRFGDSARGKLKTKFKEQGFSFCDLKGGIKLEPPDNADSDDFIFWIAPKSIVEGEYLRIMGIQWIDGVPSYFEGSMTFPDR